MAFQVKLLCALLATTMILTSNAGQMSISTSGSYTAAAVPAGTQLTVKCNTSQTAIQLVSLTLASLTLSITANGCSLAVLSLFVDGAIFMSSAREAEHNVLRALQHLVSARRIG